MKKTSHVTIRECVNRQTFDLWRAYFVTQEIKAIHSEANVRVSGKAVHPVKGEFTEPNLGRGRFTQS